jgi:hypothetical protein
MCPSDPLGNHGQPRRGAHAPPSLAEKEGAVAVDFTVGADAVRSLIELGWLAPERRGDRHAVAGAIVVSTC